MVDTRDWQSRSRPRDFAGSSPAGGTNYQIESISPLTQVDRLQLSFKNVHGRLSFVVLNRPTDHANPILLARPQQIRRPHVCPTRPAFAAHLTLGHSDQLNLIQMERLFDIVRHGLEHQLPRYVFNLHLRWPRKIGQVAKVYSTV